MLPRVLAGSSTGAIGEPGCSEGALQPAASEGPACAGARRQHVAAAGHAPAALPGCVCQWLRSHLAPVAHATHPPNHPASPPTKPHPPPPAAHPAPRAVCALVCTRTDAELTELLEGVGALDLAFFAPPTLPHAVHSALARVGGRVAG